ncbi:MAG: ribosome silencing factor [Balneolales bacterium]
MTQNLKLKNIENNAQSNFKDSGKLVNVIGAALLEKKGENIILLDVTRLTTLTDYFIVCHGNSETQIKALSGNVSDKTVEKLGERVWRKEGLDAKRWIVMDYVNVVVHIFNKETREHYGLERMWNDAEVSKISDN